MKKTFLIATVAAFAAVSSYGQGFLNWQGFNFGVQNNYTTPGTVANTAGITVELLFAPSTSVKAQDSIAASTAQASAGSLTYNVDTAWTAILADANFAAVNNFANNGPATVLTAATGGFTYDGSAAYGASNLTGGTTYHMYELAWSGGYATAALAAAAHAYVGWSATFAYTATTSGNPAPVKISATQAPSFWVGGITSTPEPGTMALAALGGASLLLFRRRK